MARKSSTPFACECLSGVVTNSEPAYHVNASGGAAENACAGQDLIPKESAINRTQLNFTHIKIVFPFEKERRGR